MIRFGLGSRGPRPETNPARASVLGSTAGWTTITRVVACNWAGAEGQPARLADKIMMTIHGHAGVTDSRPADSEGGGSLPVRLAVSVPVHSLSAVPIT